MKDILSSAIGSMLLFLPLYCASIFAEPPIFGAAACERKIVDPSLNAMVEEVFLKKFERLASEGKLPDSFGVKNKELEFAVCDNSASYDTFVVYGKGVVFDYQMIAFLFAQSRALIVGRYIARTKQFDVHRALVRQFVKQDSTFKINPLEIIKKKAIELGVSTIAYDNMLADSDFKRREQTFFLHALYFLSMHERCHVALDHGVRLGEIKHMLESKKISVKQQLELDADRCAIDLVNIDEAQFKNSPISFFGVLMTTATQFIVYNQPTLVTYRSHPSTRERMANAQDIVLKYISNSRSTGAQNYETTINGTAEYFNNLLADLEIGF